MLKHAILIFIFSIPLLIFSQKKSTISGYIKDAETGEAQIGASVYVPSLNTGATCNEFGFYSLTLPNGEYEMFFRFIGYEVQKILITLDEDIKYNVELKSANTLNEVTVTTEKKQHESTEMSTINLSMSKVKSLPVLLGEVDIIKTAQLLPGIQSGSEGSSGIYVRGGGPDQNLILLDGVPIYNANHLFGFFSVFNADAINNVKIIKGGFPAQYGGRLSSVLDIRMNEGDMKKIHGEGSVGIISSKLMLNGPIIKDKTSFMISARRTYIDILAAPFIKAAAKKNGSESSGGYFFYDVNGKINHIIDSNNRVYLSSYLGNDKFSVKDKYNYFNGNKEYVDESNGKIAWGNRITALRWNHQFNSKLFSNVTANYSNYQFTTGFGSNVYEKSIPSNALENFSFEYLSGITDFSGLIDFYYYPSPKHNIQFGVGETYHTFKPGVNNFTISGDGTSIDTTYGSSNTYAHEFYTYFQDEIKFNERFSGNFGVHFSNFIVKNKYYNSLQPRASINYIIDDNSSLKGSYSRTAQYLHLLSNTSIGLPTDLWVPATDRVKPQDGHQVALGYARELKKGFRMTTEAYYKTMNNLIEYKDGASFFSASQSWEDKVETGDGYSYGAEFLLEKRTGNTTGWIGYTLSWTNRQFDNLNNGEAFPYRYDRRHDISIVVTHKFSDKIDVGAVWVYGTGNAVSLALQQYNSLGDVDFGPTVVEHIEERNGYRMPAYHRLDLGVNIHKKKKWGEATWSFGLYNSYNRRNPFYLEFGYAKNSNRRVLNQVSLFPVLPSVSYNFKF